MRFGCWVIVSLGACIGCATPKPKPSLTLLAYQQQSSLASAQLENALQPGSGKAKTVVVATERTLKLSMEIWPMEKDLCETPCTLYLPPGTVNLRAQENEGALSNISWALPESGGRVVLSPPSRNQDHWGLGVLLSGGLLMGISLIPTTTIGWDNKDLALKVGLSTMGVGVLAVLLGSWLLHDNPTRVEQVEESK